MATNLIPAAQYVRMSTHQQQYSIANQSATIQAYAESHGFEVVRTYADPGRSGMLVQRRPALKQLIQDVISGHAQFKAVLVYDVSRWGRFQDIDEPAHYEFLCKSSGVPVHYCAETFTNDNNLANAIMKALKRTMAGEYSRELGVKISAGLRRAASFGFKQGGPAVYGMRRMLVSQDGQRKQELKFGERKSLATDRVILVPGPVEEVQVVRDIYRMLVNENMSFRAISAELNRRGVESPGVGGWDFQKVQNIFKRPQYAGCHVFGRTSSRLYTPPIRMPASEWVVTPRAFKPLVDEAMFEQAQKVLKSRTFHKSDEVLLSELRGLLAQEGRLSYRLVEQFIASPNTFRYRFGGVRRAYNLIGYGSAKDFGSMDLRRRTQALREELLHQIAAMFPNDVSIVQRNGKWRSMLRFRNRSTIAVLIARHRPPRIGHVNSVRWRIGPRPQELHQVTLLARLKEGNSDFLDYHVFPSLGRRKMFEIRDDDPYLRNGIRLAELSTFCMAVLEANRMRKR